MELIKIAHALYRDNGPLNPKRQADLAVFCDGLALKLKSYSPLEVYII